MNSDVQSDKQARPDGQDRRPAWQAPTLAEYDIVTNTEITNCGNGEDGIICQSPAS